MSLNGDMLRVVFFFVFFKHVCLGGPTEAVVPLACANLYHMKFGLDAHDIVNEICVGS